MDLDKSGSLWSDFASFSAAHKEMVYNKILEYMPDNRAPPDFLNMMKCYITRKGQYRRPMYAILWSLLYGGKVEDTVLPAAAQQVSEDYFLMHDDWMDDNSFRRGLPAAHVLYAPEYAIDAGDALQTVLWRIVNDAREALGKKRGAAYFDKFYDIMLVTHIGQYLDLRLTRDSNDITKFTMEDYFNSIHAKSAYYTVYGPMQCGAIIAGAQNGVIDGIKEYGTLAGMAFQIKDDILDCISTEAQLGKSIGTDVKEGVKTVILWHAVNNAGTADLKKMREIYAKPGRSKTKEEVDYVLRKFTELGSIEFAEKEARRMSDEALRIFNGSTKDVPESDVKNIARESIGHTTKRHK